MLSSSPDSSALCASAPFFRPMISSLSPCLAAKSCLPTIHMKPASPLGSITPCFHGLSSCAQTGCPNASNSKNRGDARRYAHGGKSREPPPIIGGFSRHGNARPEQDRGQCGVGGGTGSSGPASCASRRQVCCQVRGWRTSHSNSSTSQQASSAWVRAACARSTSAASACRSIWPTGRPFCFGLKSLVLPNSFCKCSCRYPAISHRITKVNLAPADLPKEQAAITTCRSRSG